MYRDDKSEESEDIQLEGVGQSTQSVGTFRSENPDASGDSDLIPTKVSERPMRLGIKLE